MNVFVVALHEPVSPATLLLPAAIVGVMDGEKKPEGYESVMVPPAGMEFAGVNPRMTGTDDLPALRSLAEMLKYTSEMGRNIPPECTAADGSTSVEVCTVTPRLPLVNPPMVNPANVMANAEGGMTPPAVVMTTDVVVVALHEPVSPATLLLPAATVGVMDGAKKPEGYVSVMVPPEGMGFKGVKPSVTGTDDLPDFRSLDEI